jgi:hypothetical protein
LGPKLQVGFHENLVLVALNWSQIFGATLLLYGRHVGQVEVWAKPLYKVLWPNLQHLSSAIGQCLGFFGTSLVCKAPLSIELILGHEEGMMSSIPSLVNC